MTNPFERAKYQRHNARRLEHLASLKLDLNNQSVLELGAGVGDHTTFFLDRGCDVVSVEGRSENVKVYEKNLNRYGLRCRIMLGDLEKVDTLECEPAEIVYCYGLLYHIGNPETLLGWMSRHCLSLLLLETHVAFGDHEASNLLEERQSNRASSLSGLGCRPTRPWLLSRLKTFFPYVYLPCTQPRHKQFTLDWTRPRMSATSEISRAVFVASRLPLHSALLLRELPSHQTRL